MTKFAIIPDAYGIYRKVPCTLETKSSVWYCDPSRPNQCGRTYIMDYAEGYDDEFFGWTEGTYVQLYMMDGWYPVSFVRSEPHHERAETPEMVWPEVAKNALKIPDFLNR